MKFYSISEQPLQIYGLAVADEKMGHFWRLPSEMQEKLPKYTDLARRTVGGRVRFCTDSPNLTIRMTLEEVKEVISIPLSGSAGADVYVGIGRESRFIDYIAPDAYSEDNITIEKTFYKNAKMQPVTINLPRNAHLLSMEIGVEDNAVMAEAPAYAVQKPIVFYGSSITEGGCASRVGSSYTSTVCRWLDADYINLGFSGNAKGEPEFAEYIAGLEPMSAFVLDYDHNAPSPEYLTETHERFFRIIREKQPKLPILILSKPDTDKNPEESRQRRDIIYQTYVKAKAAGDTKVWFVDGSTLFGNENRTECTIDGTHPNALGFMRMAETIYPVLKEILHNCIGL